MIEKSEDQKGLYFVTCDLCGHKDDIEAPNWGEMILTIKGLKWYIANRYGEWIHHCPDCQELKRYPD